MTSVRRFKIKICILTNEYRIKRLLMRKILASANILLLRKINRIKNGEDLTNDNFVHFNYAPISSIAVQRSFQFTKIHFFIIKYSVVLSEFSLTVKVLFLINNYNLLFIILHFLWLIWPRCSKFLNFLMHTYLPNF